MMASTVELAIDGAARIGRLARDRAAGRARHRFADPHADGLAVARYARSRRPGLPVFLVTGYPDLVARSEDGLAPPPVVHTKPVDYDALMEELRDCAEGVATPAPTPANRRRSRPGLTRRKRRDPWQGGAVPFAGDLAAPRRAIGFHPLQRAQPSGSARCSPRAIGPAGPRRDRAALGRQRRGTPATQLHAAGSVWEGPVRALACPSATRSAAR